MKNRITSLTTLLVISGAVLGLTDLQAADKLKILLIDGQNNHKWQKTTPVLIEALESCGEFKVSVSTTPAKGATTEAWAAWKPGFAQADVVLSNYNGQDWPEEVKKDFVAYVKGGGGLVVVHAADNSFGNWVEYNQMIGVGGWGERKIGRDGAWVHVVDGKLVRDTDSAMNAGAHGSREPFVIEHLDLENPITKGLPTKWMHQKDELYCRLCGPAQNLSVQGSALSPVTKRNEPMLMTIIYGKGRIFHTTLGHDVEAMRCRGFFTLLQRGTEWSATGKVERTAKIPADFPTVDKVSVVPAP